MMMSLKIFSVWLFSLFVIGVAQGTITGTITASEVTGLMVIACYADAQLGCNESLSSSTQITTSGSSASYQFENLAAGQYLIFLWQDSNGNGELEETLDTLHYYATIGEEVTLVSPPAQTINFSLVATSTTSGASVTVSGNTELVRSWSTTRYFGDYVNANTGAYEGDSQTAHWVTFNADGTYTMLDYYNLNFNCQWFRSKGTYQVSDNIIVFQTLEYEIAKCGQAFTLQANETREYLWRFMQHDDGVKLELLDVDSYRDEQDWFYANDYSSITETTSSQNTSTNPLTTAPSSAGMGR
jgi:Uncharacterized protein conserved in bacteria (DUF2141)